MKRALNLLFFLSAWSLAWAGPENFSVVSGEASLQVAPNLWEMHTTNKTILEWESFSIQKGEMVHFLQPSESASVLNRVTGNLCSEILGTLKSNGNIYLINPRGIIFGEESIIDTASFLASTLDVSNLGFSQGEDLLCEGLSEEPLVQLGSIQARNGDIFLIAHRIEQKGSLRAPKGAVSLTTGHEVLLRPKLCPLLSIRRDLSSLGIVNSGTIEALDAYLQTDGSNGFMLEQSGEISLLEEGGKLILSSNAGFMTVAQSAHVRAPRGEIKIHLDGEKPLYLQGTLDVTGIAGGSIEITAPKLLNTATLKADGIAGNGGSISIKVEDSLIETSFASFSASGLEGGSVSQFASHLFTSGSYQVSGEVGGNITLFGDDLSLVASKLCANGTKVGGTVLIGGDFQGKNPSVYNAKNVFLAPYTQIEANGGELGGKIIVWSDGITKNFAEISAKDGGFIEVSGKLELHQGGTTDAGVGGEVLLDPQTINIALTNGAYPNYLITDPNPGSGSGFPGFVKVLATGNIVASKPQDNFAATQSGAVYLFNGATGALISTITGSSNSDQIGSSGVAALWEGNFVIKSAEWSRVNPSAIIGVGAATWGSGVTGVSGTVSVENSLIGSTAGDAVGLYLISLVNGNYVVISPLWDRVDPSPVVAVGAATWGDGAMGTSGTVSVANSLIGSSANDSIGFSSPAPPLDLALPNGNYVIVSPNWDDGATAGVGAVTWGNGSNGTTGTVSVANSLIGTTASDQVGKNGVFALTNSNYVVISTLWNNGAVSDAGAVTWGSGTEGVTGTVSSLNSLIGSTASDQIGSDGVVALTNGNYVVLSSAWDDGASANVGAATWGNGILGVTGTVSVANSLIGSIGSDAVGTRATALTNGNYVVISTNWRNGAVIGAGAVTWGDGTTGITGTVSTANSLVGSTASDVIGSSGAFALTDGSYVVCSPLWDDGGTANVGAATWCIGTGPTTGTVSASNSLIGTTLNDNVSSGFSTALSDVGVTVLTNGNYIVNSPFWNNGGVADAGAATWIDGNGVKTGTVSTANSLVGTSASDRVGFLTYSLPNGNYVVTSRHWTNGAVAAAGAATWGNGVTGTTGTVSVANSLVGSTASDAVSANGRSGVVALSTGDYLVISPDWDRVDGGALVDAGAVSMCNGASGTSGTVSQANSVIGQESNSALGTAIDNTAIYSTFVCPFGDIYGGEEVIRVGVSRADASFLGYSIAPEQSFTIAPSYVTTTLNSGTSIVFQANNDITVTDALSYNTGNLTLRAGRSVLINANITTGGANLRVVANDLLSSGVVDAYRTAGTAVITINSSIAINAQGGNLFFSILDDATKTNNTSGNFSLSGSASLATTGNGTISVLSQVHSIALFNLSTITCGSNNVILTAGEQILIGE